jgi:hypothetical protein
MDTIIKILYDIKTYIALAITGIESFFGPTYHSIYLIIIVANLDVFVGYYKNKKLKGEKFSVKRVYEKFGQLGRFIIVLAASILSDHFFKNNGIAAFWVSNKICDVFAIWQFLHMLENVGQMGDNEWITALKKILGKKINEITDLTEVKKEDFKDDKKDEVIIKEEEKKDEK